MPYADRDRDTTFGPCPMAEHLVPDELWMFINPLLQPEGFGFCREAGFRTPSPVAGTGLSCGRGSR